jgi:hypothetical protein
MSSEREGTGFTPQLGDFLTCLDRSPESQYIQIVDKAGVERGFEVPTAALIVLADLLTEVSAGLPAPRASDSADLTAGEAAAILEKVGPGFRIP